MDGAGLAILFGLGAAVGWGVGDFWAARTSKTIGPLTTLIFISAFGALLFSALYVCVLRPDTPITAIGAWYAVVGGLGIAIAGTLFYKGLAVGPVSLVSPITAAYPLITTLWALAVFNASLSVLQIASICMIVAGVMITADILGAIKGTRKLGRGPMLALMAILFYGSSFALLSQSTARIGWESTTLIQCWAILVGMFAILPYAKGKEQVFAHVRSVATNPFIIGNTLAGYTAIVLLNAGFQHEKAAGAVIVAVSACYPVITVILALRHFKERVEVVPLLGALATVAGVVILSVG